MGQCLGCRCVAARVKPLIHRFGPSFGYRSPAVESRLLVYLFQYMVLQTHHVPPAPVGPLPTCQRLSLSCPHAGGIVTSRLWSLIPTALANYNESALATMVCSKAGGAAQSHCTPALRTMLYRTCCLSARNNAAAPFHQDIVARGCVTTLCRAINKHRASPDFALLTCFPHWARRVLVLSAEPDVRQVLESRPLLEAGCSTELLGVEDGGEGCDSLSMLVQVWVPCLLMSTHGRPRICCPTEMNFGSQPTATYLLQTVECAELLYPALPTVEHLVQLFADPGRRRYKSLQYRAESVALTILKTIEIPDSNRLYVAVG